MRIAVLDFASVAVVLLSLGAPAGQAQSYDAMWSFADNGPLGYRLDAYNPVHLQVALFVRENPTVPLELGKRYQLTVANHAAYPLEVIAKGASVEQDKVLLSMGSDVGIFTADPEVNWQDLGQGVVRFTLTPHLYHAMVDGGGTPGYRCRTQPETMRGEFLVKSNPLLTQRIAFHPSAMN
jgi:hypothetical protein